MGDATAGSDADELAALRAECEHLRLRLATSEVVEAALLRERAERERAVADAARLAGVVEQFERHLADLRAQVRTLTAELRTVRAAAEREMRHRTLAERRLRDLETSRSLRIGRAVVGAARLGRGAGGATDDTGSAQDVEVTATGSAPPGAGPTSPGPPSAGPAPDGPSPEDPDPEVRAGAVAVRDERSAPIVLVEALDAGEALIEALAPRLTELAGDHRAILVTDVDRFDLYREHDLVAEYVPPMDDLRRSFGGSAGRVRAERLDDLHRLHRPDLVRRPILGEQGPALVTADGPADAAG